MNLEFIKIEIQNFKSVGELVTLNYQDLKGLNFVFGKNLDVQNAKNGSGKSTLMIDSLSFALFGKTLKNTNNKYIPNRSMPDKLKPYVKVYFKSDEQLYSCETYGRVVAKTMSTIGMELLKLNDDYSVAEDLTQSSVAKTKQYIQDNLLGCSFNVFKSSVIMTSADFMNFYEGMNKDQKRKYVENIFNLDCFGEMYSMIKVDMNDTKKEVTNAKNQMISLSERIEDLQKKSDNYLEDRKLKIQSLKKKLIEKKNEIVSLKEELSKFKDEDIDSLKSKKEEKKNQYSDLQKKYNDAEKAIIRLESEMSHNNKMIEQTIKIMDGLCEKCTAFIKEKYNYIKYENENVKHEDEIKNLKEFESSIGKDIESLKKEINDISVLIDKNITEKMKKDRILTSLKYATNELLDMKQKYDESEKNDENPFTDILLKAEKDNETIKERLNGFIKNIKHFEILKDATSENGIKKFIMKDIVKLLNSLIQKYLNEIGCEFIVYFDETFEFKFITTTGECEFSSFSAGEKQRIQIATLLSFRDLILNGKISSNIFIIDELLDANVDTACIENVMNILKRKATESNQNIFIISHRSELADNMSFWNNIIKVTKENQQSRYEVI